jgi:hypothetical protein
MEKHQKPALTTHLTVGFTPPIIPQQTDTKVDNIQICERCSFKYWKKLATNEAVASIKISSN